MKPAALTCNATLLLGPALLLILSHGATVGAGAAFSQSKTPSPQSGPAQAPTAKAPAKTSTAGKAPSKKSAARSRRPRPQTAPTPERIKEIQAALTRAGYYQGEPTGKWDTTTQDALRRFQANEKLDATGQLSARTLQKLGLGSPVAGLAPPRPAAPPD